MLVRCRDKRVQIYPSSESIIKTTNFSLRHFYTFYSWKMFERIFIHSLDHKLKILFLFFKMLIRCRDTRVPIYPTSARKIKSTNCSTWQHLYFLLMADGWNFYDIFLRPWTKSTFLIFKMIIRCWDARVQVKSKVSIVRPGLFYIFCLQQMVEIFVIHS